MNILTLQYHPFLFPTSGTKSFGNIKSLRYEVELFYCHNNCQANLFSRPTDLFSRLTFTDLFSRPTFTVPPAKFVKFHFIIHLFELSLALYHYNILCDILLNYNLIGLMRL